MRECPHGHVPREARDAALAGMERLRGRLGEAQDAYLALARERNRLREGIRAHRQAVYAELTCCDDCRAVGKEPSHTSAHDAALWALLDDQEDDRG